MYYTEDRSLEFTKVCSNCKIEKSSSYFYATKFSKDGLQSECKVCAGARKSKKRVQNKESALALISKPCSRCLMVLDISNFSKRPDSPSGLSSACKSCTAKD